jgi:hypothetical protein
MSPEDASANSNTCRDGTERAAFLLQCGKRHSMRIISDEHKDDREQQRGQNCGGHSVPKCDIIGDKRRDEREPRKQRDVAPINRAPIY